MAQFDFPRIVPTTDTGTTLSNNLNSLIPALYSTQSGTNRPPYAVANQLWVSTGTPTEHKLYLFDGTQDQLIASFDPTKINSLRSGDGLSKADGGTVVKPVIFDSVITPKKGVMGRLNAAKAGEIGERTALKDYTIWPAGTHFDATSTVDFDAPVTIPIPSDGYWAFTGMSFIYCNSFITLGGYGSVKLSLGEDGTLLQQTPNYRAGTHVFQDIKSFWVYLGYKAGGHLIVPRLTLPNKEKMEGATAFLIQQSSFVRMA